MSSGRARGGHSSQQEKGMDRRELEQREPFGGQAPLTLASDVTRYGGSETVVKGDVMMKATSSCPSEGWWQGRTHCYRGRDERLMEPKVKCLRCPRKQHLNGGLKINK